MSMGKRILLSLGGNALGTGSAELVKSVDAVAKPIASLVEQRLRDRLVSRQRSSGRDVEDVHRLRKRGGEVRRDAAVRLRRHEPELHRSSPAKCHREELKRKNNPLRFDGDHAGARGPEDPHFSHPTKPVGAFLTREEALAREGDGKVYRDSGRGYREIVPSPVP